MAVRAPAVKPTTSMKVSEKTAPAAAIVAALSTLACCVPLGFLGAVGLAGVSVWAQQYRLLLVVASLGFMWVGAAQLYFRKSCVKRSTTSLMLFWTAVVLVVLAGCGKTPLDACFLPRGLAAICLAAIAGTREDFGGSNLEGLGQAVYPLG